MLTKVVAGVLAAPVLLVVLRWQGASPSLQSPILLADLCGLFAIVAATIAFFGSDPDRKEDSQARPISLSPAARPPRWPNM